jgi:SNF family Na+-dependent transporter
MSKSNAVQQWGTRIGLILAMAGNAVGLGNFLRFPVQAIQNGGGAFIIPYLISFLLMGLPLLWVEWAMGRYGGRFGNHSTPFIFRSMGPGGWKYIGAFGIFINVGMAAYYVYIESWTLAYTWYSVTGVFDGMTENQVVAFFNNYVDVGEGRIFNVPPAAIFFFVLTLGLNTWILSRGLKGGIEAVSKICMPLLLLFGAVLAVNAVTLQAGSYGANYDAAVGLNYLWEPQFDSLARPGVWLAAAGQVFFTLSLGMGSIICYASYIESREDIALNAMTSGWINEFVEIVLGASIVIPIAVGYMGLEWTIENAGFMMGFQTMPYLFEQWGAALSVLSGVLWFGLLFFAGITSSLAMGTPVMAFMLDEFKWSIQKSALIFGLIVAILALPCILFFQQGVFDEFDYWTGTVLLVVFAFSEVVLFAWVFGMDKGWAEIMDGAELKIPLIYRWIIKYVTTVFIGVVLVASLISPVDNSWVLAIRSLFQGEGWPLAPDSIIGKVFHIGVEEVDWFVNGVPTGMFFVDMSRLLLLVTFLGICWMIRKAVVARSVTEQV